MTNKDIINGNLVLLGLDPMTVFVDTFAGWNRRGFKVKKGEKATFKTKIWKPSKHTVKEEKDGQEVEQEYENMILVNAAFFRAEQVEKIEEVKA